MPTRSWTSWCCTTRSQLGMQISATAVRTTLRRHGLDPAPRRAPTTWQALLRQQPAGIVACDFFTVDTIWPRRLSVLFFIELDNRWVQLAGVTPNPNAAWISQQARNLLLALDERRRRVRFLLRDPDVKFCRGFDDVLGAEGVKVLLTPVLAPNANVYAERWIRTVRYRVPGLAADRWVRPPGGGPRGSTSSTTTGTGGTPRGGCSSKCRTQPPDRRSSARTVGAACID